MHEKLKKQELSQGWRTPKLLDGLITSPKVKTLKGKGVGSRSLIHNISGVEGRVGAPGYGLGILTSNPIIHTNPQKPTQPNNKLVSA
jgi:hypothetical protein